ncbi:MAG: hypothetical protein KJ011_06945 [Burkholderiaceae bacterium]|nr:hypothetical protein [Burkholderiaceae bacterium]
MNSKPHVQRIGAFELDCKPLPYREDGFSARVRVIRVSDGKQIRAVGFPALDAYRTEHEAVAAGLEYGRRIVRSLAASRPSAKAANARYR